MIISDHREQLVEILTRLTFLHNRRLQVGELSLHPPELGLRAGLLGSSRGAHGDRGRRRDAGGKDFSDRAGCFRICYHVGHACDGFAELSTMVLQGRGMVLSDGQ